MDAGLSLACLNADLDAVEAALRVDDYLAAGESLDDLDRHQRAWLAQPDALADVAGLTALEGRQQRILRMMAEQRDDAARRLRQGVAAGRAARAYLTAESLS